MRAQRTWDKVLTVETFACFPPGLPGVERHLSQAELPLDEFGRLDAPHLLRTFRGSSRCGYTLLLLNEDLHAGRIGPVFGYASRRHRMAVVSACRLRDPQDDALTQRRIANVAAHELGHLNGLKHCRTEGCLMHPARTPADIDQRSGSLCDRCAQRPMVLRGAIILAAFLLVFFAADRGFRLLPELEPAAPFSMRTAALDHTGQLLFKGQVVLSSASLADRNTDVAHRLNAAYRSVHTSSLEATSIDGAEVLRLNGVRLLDVTPADADKAPPAEIAEKWAGSLQQLLVTKSHGGEICSDCHVRRQGEVIAWAGKHAR